MSQEHQKGHKENSFSCYLCGRETEEGEAIWVSASLISPAKEKEGIEFKVPLCKKCFKKIKNASPKG